ncbi:hypothetical protein KO500_02700 [Cellulophaga baltica]|uniref:hypothetical protein n=1 Tax=Cellulophaga TaxID=104264 RepID=UPI001C07AC33|nr:MULTISPECIES: hypothetical protein [Cellulophaga]MBU2995320.1 hypothetical protein [Cellulophaga baltica]MDO6766715.1 hypothetical protein [Cellulophaga sp. 1_MG-2023]
MNKYLILLLISLSTTQINAQTEESSLLLELNMEYQYLKMAIEDNKDLVYIHDNLSDMERYLKLSKAKVEQAELDNKTKKMIIDYLDSYSSIKPIQVFIGTKKDETTLNQFKEILFILRESLNKIYKRTLNSEFIHELDILSGIYASGKKFYPLYSSSQKLLLKNKKVINELYPQVRKKNPEIKKFVKMLNKKEEFSIKDLDKIMKFFLADLRKEYIDTISTNLKN